MKHRSNYTRSHQPIHGFTLVELLVVISIIAMLLSILMPSLGRARQMAQRVVCMTNMKTFGLANEMYANESNDWLTPVLNDNSEIWFRNPLYVDLIQANGRKNSDVAYNETRNILTLPDDFKCPSDKRSEKNGYYVSANLVLGVSYGMNCMSIYPKPPSGWYRGTNHGLRRTQVVRPSDKFCFMDSLEWALHRDSANYKAYWDVYGEQAGSYRWGTPSYRHFEGANVTFYDGSVRYLRKEEVYNAEGNFIQQKLNNNKKWLPIPGREFMDDLR